MTAAELDFVRATINAVGDMISKEEAISAIEREAADPSARAVPQAAQAGVVASRPSDWLPIASAPKDGTAFRAYAPALVHADFNPWGSVEAVWDGESRFIGALWDGQHDVWTTQFIEPTHWRPLPDPPVVIAPSSPPPELLETKDDQARRHIGGLRDQ